MLALLLPTQPLKLRFINASQKIYNCIVQIRCQTPLIWLNFQVASGVFIFTKKKKFLSQESPEWWYLYVWLFASLLQFLQESYLWLSRISTQNTPRVWMFTSASLPNTYTVLLLPTIASKRSLRFFDYQVLLCSVLEGRVSPCRSG